MKRRVVFDVAGHGFGHLAQSAPVIDRLCALRPRTEVVVRTTLAPALVRSLLGARVGVRAAQTEVGMVMRSPNDVEPVASHRAHLAFHADWYARVDREGRDLRALGADLLVSNVGYLGLAGAGEAGIPALAFSSLDWARIYGHYCGRMPGARRVLAEMRAGYAAADTFLSLAPGLARHGFRRVRRVGPVGARGQRDREALARRAGAAPGAALVLVSPGGIASTIDLEHWPSRPGRHLIAPAALRGEAAHSSALESIAWAHVDVLASVDAVVTKPGYGTFVDAACNGRPVVYTLRPDWPEEPRLGRWLEARVPTRRIAWHDLVSGRLDDALGAVLDAGPVPATEPHGIEEVVAEILDRL